MPAIKLPDLKIRFFKRYLNVFFFNYAFYKRRKLSQMKVPSKKAPLRYDLLGLVFAISFYIKLFSYLHLRS